MIAEEQAATQLLAQRMLSVAEVAASLGVNRGTVRQWIRLRHILGFRSGPLGHFRVPISEVQRMKGGS